MLLSGVCLSDVCLSVCLLRASGLSREQRGYRKTKIGTEVAHVTPDSTPLSRSEGQGHQAALLTAVLVRQAAAAVGVRTCWPWETAATLPSARRRMALRHPRGWDARGRGGRPPTACFIKCEFNAEFHTVICKSCCSYVFVYLLRNMYSTVLLCLA